MIDNEKEYIACSAIWFDDGDESHNHKPFNIKTGFVIYGRNHHHCYATASSLFKRFQLDPEKDREIYVDGVLKIEKTSGFMTDRGNFVDREIAAKIAFDAGQIETEIKTLYSEDIFRKSDFQKSES